jgi:hypothetical protein
MIAFSKKVDLGICLGTRYTDFNANDTDMKITMQYFELHVVFYLVDKEMK